MTRKLPTPPRSRRRFAASSVGAARTFSLHVYLALGLLLLALAALQLLARVGSSSDVPQTRLAELPLRVDGWRGVEQEFDPEVVTALGADDWVVREYRDDSGELVWLYVGFSRGISFVTPASPHSPLLCYPGQGWEPIEKGLHPIQRDGDDTQPIVVNKLLVQKGTQQRLVLYWQQWGEQMSPEEDWGDYRAKLAWLLRLPQMLLNRERTDRALVRISAPVVADVDETLSREVAFIRSILPALAERLSVDVSSIRPTGRDPAGERAPH